MIKKTNIMENCTFVSYKVKVPLEFYSILDNLLELSRIEVDKMLKDRTKSSSKYYDTIPCVLAKSLITKYQKNKKLKSVKRLVLPICGDKGKQVKLDGDGLRIPALFKKKIIPVIFPKPVFGTIRQVEFFKRKKVWFITYQFYTLIENKYNPSNIVGIDRNSRGNVAVLANLKTGKVLKFGPDTDGLKYNYRRRRANLQKKGSKKLLVVLNRKQSNRTKDINHKVSRSIVDYAKKHCSVIVLEDLGTIRKGKAKKYTEKSQWSFFQLETFLKYKAALSGVPVYYVPAAYTSKRCSRCGSINNPNGKHFKCSVCGHFDHRDSNAAFNIAMSFEKSNGIPSAFTVGHIDEPRTGGKTF